MNKSYEVSKFYDIFNMKFEQEIFINGLWWLQTRVKMGKEDPIATSWITMTNPIKDDVVAQDWMKSLEIVLNNNA
jgi:hypothetical protein